MKNCQLKKGIFVQRMCNGETETSCDSCGVDVCVHHSRQLDGSVLCLNCYQKEHQANQVTKGEDYRSMYAAGTMDYYTWYWFMRSDYYDHSDTEVFDESDYGEFENYSDQEMSYSDSDDDFYDS